MDASLVSSLYLAPDWISRMMEDHEYEVKAAKSWSPLRLMGKDGRKALWMMCSVLGVDANGVPGQACRLFERFLYNHVHNFFRIDRDYEEWESYKRVLSSRIPLLMVSCVQLAAKMNSAGMQMNATLVRTCLICKGIFFSIDDIIRSEFQVFSTLGFRVPLWTSLDAAHMLAVEVGLPASYMGGVAPVVNIAEFRRQRLASAVREIVIGNLQPSSAFADMDSLGTLHLAAGAVAASARYLAVAIPDPVPRLAHLTRAPASYIKCVCDTILADVLIDDADICELNVQPRKRKRNH